MNNSNDIKSNKVFECSSKNFKNTNNGFEFYSKQSKTENSHLDGLYDFEGTIGQGHFAVVKLARHIFSGEKVAIKVIDKNKLDDISKEHLFQEVKCMKLVQHPNVVRLYEVIDTTTKLYLILELGDGGDMYDYIMKHSNGLSESKSKNYFRQIVRAIKYCHDLHVVHRDLKPENVVFFEQTGQVKLTDFGFSNIFVPGTKLYTSCGSLAYSAPEILLGDSYDAPAVDVWSLGVILYMLASGRAPFQEANDSETLTMILDCKYYLPSHVSLECNDLISRMLVRDPEKRIKLDEISNHSWLRSNSDDEEKSNSSSDSNLNDLQQSADYVENEEEDADDDDDDEIDFASKRRHDKINYKENQHPIKRKKYCTGSKDKIYKKYIPLIKRENLSEKDNNDIIENMIAGKIAPREEIINALNEDKYNYITATYYLVAEKVLRKQFQKRNKRKISSNAQSINNKNFKPLVKPLNDSSHQLANNGKNNEAYLQIKTSNKNTTSNIKATYLSNKATRNKLVRQDEANEFECEEGENIPVPVNNNKKTDELTSKQDDIILMSQTPLTNILEDEEEPTEEEMVSKTDLNSLVLINNLNMNQPVLTSSRRSSRGGDNTNTIAALTILEEVETDNVSMSSLNTNCTVRVSNSKLKLYPYNKQNNDESKINDINDGDIENVDIKKNELNRMFSTSSDKLNNDSKTKIKLFTTKVPSSGADTSSDTSDTELRNLSLNTKEMKDFDWNRSASSSSRSRSKSSRQANQANLAVLNEKQRSRPLSISSETNNKEDTASLKQQNSFNMRTKSLAEDSSNNQANSGYLNQNKQYLSVSSSNSNDHLTNFNTIGKSLSTEHRIANMSQMSINSQLSKNNSLRFPNRSGACDTPIQYHQHSTTPTPRESIVFNRGDEKPIAKILLNQHAQLKSQNSGDFSSIINQSSTQHNSISSASSSPRSSLRSQPNVNTKNEQELIFDETLINSKLNPAQNSYSTKTESELLNQESNLTEKKNSIHESIKSLNSTLSLTASTRKAKTLSIKGNSDSICKNSFDENNSRTEIQENMKSLTLESKHIISNEKLKILTHTESNKDRKPKRKKNGNQTIQKSETDLLGKKYTREESFSANKLYTTKACTKCCTIV